MATQGATKVSRLDRQFKAADGKLTPRVHDGVVALVFKTPANEKQIEVPLSSFPEGIRSAAMAYGLNATIGNAMGNLDESELDDPDEVMEAIQERIKSLQAGKWAGERTGGGRPSMVWAAFQEWRKQSGKKDDEKRLVELHTQWFADETNHKALLANDKFSVFLAAYKAARAKKPAVVASSADLLA